MGKKVASIASSPLSGIGGLMGGGAKDLLFGKVQGGIDADPIVNDLRATNVRALELQREGMDRFDKLSKQDTGAIVNRQIGAEKGFAMQGAADARRRIQELAARRGMSRSSVPMFQENNLNADLSKQLGKIEAQRAGMQRAMDVSNAQLAFQPALQVSQANPMNVPLTSIQGQRRGGISGLLGAGVGGMLGGAQGAGVGYQAGQGLGGIFG